MSWEGHGVREATSVCVCLHVCIFACTLSCVTVIWWVKVHVKVLGGGHSRPSSGVTPEECSPFALWPQNMALEDWVSKHCPWTSASEESPYCGGCCHKAKGCARCSCVCACVCVCVGVINNATVITFVRGESISLEFMVNFQGMTQKNKISFTFMDDWQLI